MAHALLAECFASKKDWTTESAKALWSDLDPSGMVAAQTDSLPEKVIAACPHRGLDPTKENLVPCEYLFDKHFVAHYHGTFSKGLVWGMMHPEEAIDRYQKHRLQPSELVSTLRQQDPEGYSVPAFDEFVTVMEEDVGIYQQEFRPLPRVPEALLAVASTHATIA